MTIRFRTALLAATVLLAGCDMAPKYTRPASPAPAQWPSGAAYEAASAGQPGLAWQTLVTDPKIRTIVERALANNRDLRASLANVASARAQYRVDRAAQLPTLSADGSGTIVRQKGGTSDSYSATAGFSSFELDLFGRLKNQTKAAFETYLSTESGMRSSRLTIVSETITAYLTLASDRDLLTAARETAESAERTVALNQSLLQAGLGTSGDLESAKTVLAQAQSDIASYTTQVAQDRNALELLVGGPVEDALLTSTLADLDASIAVPPAGLSSEVLLQRPDVVEAEHSLKSANASVGAARAAFFPKISLTSTLGLASGALSDLFKGSSSNWTTTPAASIPLLGGSNSSNLAYARAQRDYYVAEYEKAVQTAFRDVADALARRGTIADQRAAQARLLDSSQRSLVLADRQYRAGVSAYLNVLTAQRTLYSARQTAIATVLADLSNRVTLYSALGADGSL
jgi:outer membrane protein, multidrug efflux system